MSLQGTLKKMLEKGAVGENTERRISAFYDINSLKIAVVMTAIFIGDTTKKNLHFTGSLTYTVI